MAYLADHIEEVVAQHGGEITTQGIVKGVLRRTDTTENSVKGELTKLVDRKVLRRVKRGVYALRGSQNNGHVNDSSVGTARQAQRRDPIYNIVASAGDGSYEISDDVIGWVDGPEAMSQPGKDVFWVFVRGDSMGSTYQKMTMVPVMRFENAQRDIREDDVYVFRLEGAVQIKRLQRLPGQQIRVISDNERYPTVTVALDDGVDFEVLGRVLV